MYLAETTKELYDQCPTLFSKLLPESEIQDDELDEDSHTYLQGNSNHVSPAALGRLMARYITQELFSSVRSSVMDTDFKVKLRSSYDTDYEIPAIMHFGGAAVP